MANALICDQCGNTVVSVIYPTEWPQYGNMVFCSKTCLVNNLSGVKATARHRLPKWRQILDILFSSQTVDFGA
jgi:hypothetical protein